MKRTLTALAAVAAVALPAAAPASAAAKVPATFFGMQAVDITAYYVDQATWDADFAAIHKAGVGVFRQSFDKRYDSSTIDQFALTAARHHLKLLPVLLDTSTFNAAKGPKHGMLGGKPKPMARYARQMVKRFGPKGSLWTGANAKYRKYAVRSWQIWNEPNLKAWWRQGPNPKAYVRLVKAVSKAIHRVDPKATIISAGIPDSHLSKPRNYKQYLTGFLKAGGWRWVDQIGTHVYTPKLKDVKRILRTYRKVLNAHHGRKLKMQVTEIGWADKGFANKMVVGPRGVATRIRGGYKLIGKLRKPYKISGVFWFDWKDFAPAADDPRGDTWGYHTGLVRADGSAKPALTAFTKAIRKLRHR